jgi:stress-induced morphogen
MNTLVKEVENRIQKHFWDHVSIDFKDEKWDGKHFYLYIVSEIFEWKSRIERSREVHNLLDDLLKTDSIHALRLKLKTPNEI